MIAGPDLSKYTRSHLAQSLILLKNKPFSLRDFPMFYAVYDGAFKKTLLKTSRQVSKSTTLANFSITESIANPHFSTFIILPDKEQTTRFSSERLGKAINFSPLIKKYFLNSDAANRVLARQFSNGSVIQLSYASDDADRCRGVSCDRLDLDECQDISVSAVLPVVQECLNNSNYKYETYSGTPKTMENGIEHLWQTSTMTEWVVKCDGCGKRTFFVSEKQVGKHGPICTRCGALVNPRNGLWIDTNPDKDVKIKGFHVSRLMIPQSVPICWNPGTPEYDRAVEAWDEVRGKMEGPNMYPVAQFRNEVLGVSASEGRRLITLEDLREMQTGPDISPFPNHNMTGRAEGWNSNREPSLLYWDGYRMVFNVCCISRSSLGTPPLRKAKKFVRS